MLWTRRTQSLPLAVGASDYVTLDYAESANTSEQNMVTVLRVNAAFTKRWEQTLRDSGKSALVGFGLVMIGDDYQEVPK